MTNPYKDLKAVSACIAHLPGLKSHKEFEIAVEVGYHQAKGMPLTLKQLMLLGIAPAATTRRCVSRLVQAGALHKVVPPNDHRATQLLLSPGLMEAFDHCLHSLRERLCNGNGSCRDD